MLSVCAEYDLGQGDMNRRRVLHVQEALAILFDERKAQLLVKRGLIGGDFLRPIK